MLSLNELIIATIFLPLLGALISGLFVRKIGDTRAQIITCVPMVKCTTSWRWSRSAVSAIASPGRGNTASRSS